MKKFLFILLAIIISGALFTGCGAIGNKITGNGDYETKNIELSIGSEYQLIIKNLSFENTIGQINILKNFETDKISLITDSNIQNKISVTLSGNTIIIKGESNYRFNTGKFEISTGAMFSKVDVEGGFNIDADNITGDAVCSFKGAVSGEIKNINSALFKLDIAGAGNLMLKGSSEDFMLDVDGTANITAFEFLTNNTEVKLAGAGFIEIFAAKTLSGNLSGVGTIRYKGNAVQTIQTLGLGTVVHVTE